jgi:hypothetical protein
MHRSMAVLTQFFFDSLLMEIMQTIKVFSPSSYYQGPYYFNCLPDMSQSQGVGIG